MGQLYTPYPGYRVLPLISVPIGTPPSGTFLDNGIYIIGQAPSGAATATFSATSGAGVTLTFSAPTLLGAAADVGRILTINDGGVFKYAIITAQNTTTVATVTLTGVLSGVGPFANNILWLSGTPNTNTSGFSVPFETIIPGCYLRFPANAVGAGIPAGLYWTVMASFTVGQVFNTLAALSGQITIPANPAPFVVLGGGAFNQTTGTFFTQASYTITANTLGRYGSMRISGIVHQNSSASTKTYRIEFGGQLFSIVAPSVNNTHTIQRTITNNGFPNLQVSEPQVADNTTIVAGPVSPVVGSVDTTIDQPLAFVQDINTTNTDWAFWNRIMVELFPAN